VSGGVTPAVSSNQREKGGGDCGEEGADMRDPLGGERERGGRALGWFPSRAGSAGLGPGCGPVGL
jgi:hypothetical protein